MSKYNLKKVLPVIAVAGLTVMTGLKPAPAEGPQGSASPNGVIGNRIGFPIHVTSAVIAEDAPIADPYTCSGVDRSPPLNWSGAPPTTKSFALIVTDPDAPSGNFTHWVAYNIPASVTELPENTPKAVELPRGGVQGMNDMGRIGYNGPCPPSGKLHHYHFRIVALDSMLGLGSGATAAQLDGAMRGHIIAMGELIGTYSR
jgi:Raf kinase inhibitor-like YbhB/YbcL family protein